MLDGPILLRSKKSLVCNSRTQDILIGRLTLLQARRQGGGALLRTMVKVRTALKRKNRGSRTGEQILIYTFCPSIQLYCTWLHYPETPVGQSPHSHKPEGFQR